MHLRFGIPFVLDRGAWGSGYKLPMKGISRPCAGQEQPIQYPPAARNTTPLLDRERGAGRTGAGGVWYLFPSTPWYGQP